MQGNGEISDPSRDAQIPRIALYGTFDVLNFGDLLFPHLLEHGLRPSPHHIKAFSPAGGRLAWQDTVEARPVPEALEFGADLHVIGGGNIIYAGATTLADYQGAGVERSEAYASLWLGAGLIAAQSDATLVWNAPGVLAPLEDARVAALRDEILAASSYVAVRDRASFKWLNAVDTLKCDVVPDTALDIGRLWPAATLREHACRAFTTRGAPVPASWLVFHVNSRYLDGDAAHQAALIDQIADTHGALPVLVAIGPCHGDDALARAVGARLRGPALIVDAPAGLKEIAALLAHCAGYVGSSLHGLITALSYGRPAIAVAKRRLVKFEGFLEHVATLERLAESWRDAQARAPQLLEALDASALAAIARAQDIVALHWARLRASIGAQPLNSVAAARKRLRQWMAQSATQDWRAFATVLEPLPPASAIPPQATSGLADREPAAVPCNICGKQGFRPDPRPLHDQVGFGARCAGCGAPARHRALRTVFEWWRGPDAKRQRCLRLGVNRVVAAGWFESFTDIDVEGDTPWNAAALEAVKQTADVVVCFDVLERAPDLSQTLRALIEALRPGGLMFLSFRHVPGRERGVEWGFPRGDLGNEYRKFGADVLQTLRRAWPDAAIAVVAPADPITGIRTRMYVLAPSTQALRWLAKSNLSAEVFP